ncbi:MAG: hypothetical protein NTW08_01405 [Gammaproteobacteria bacterium]|nr:hypothetical protein [Gammaproteobacteria bacterium]
MNGGSILSGITRDTIIKLARSLQFNVIEANISLYEAYLALVRGENPEWLAHLTVV